ncbi:hypothetical protein SAMN05421770_106248 [Granulicella rosea]|uniref:UPF0235 protein SAMN05421770_106248 n=1 Tax=Granulicella rosea TaxID=474952 RepID=A0A239LA13_9BACT|nr:DUF167 domain-containing protein [Granulicella rosea]SNT27466.1 hypothetical protein SAMN05421770_106248 [Granulicella rosea]
MSFCADAPGGCTLALRVHPGAKRNAVTGTHDNALKISLTTPPTDGRANEALLRFLADTLGLPKARISLLTGAASRSKTVRITGLNAAEVAAVLNPAEDC